MSFFERDTYGVFQERYDFIGGYDEWRSERTENHWKIVIDKPSATDADDARVQAVKYDVRRVILPRYCIRLRKSPQDDFYAANENLSGLEGYLPTPEGAAIEGVFYVKEGAICFFAAENVATYRTKNQNLTDIVELSWAESGDLRIVCCKDIKTVDYNHRHEIMSGDFISYVDTYEATLEQYTFPAQDFLKWIADKIEEKARQQKQAQRQDLARRVSLPTDIEAELTWMTKMVTVMNAAIRPYLEP